MLTLLHLSDLHFGDQHAFAQEENPQGLTSLAEEILQVLAENRIQVDHIVFTGDFFSKEQFSDLYSARDGIRKFKELLNLTDDDLSFIPGNHDLSWSQKFRKDRFIPYNELVSTFNRDDCKEPNLPALRKISKNSEDREVFLALLNSCTVEGQQLAGIGNVGPKQLKRLEEKVKTETAGLEDYVLIAALHHHLLPIYPVETKIEYTNWPAGDPKPRSSHTLDAIDVLNRLSLLKTALIIHGHQHHAAVVSYQNKLTNQPPLTIAASGSCADNSDERQFFVYEIGEQSIKILSFTEPKAITRFSLNRQVKVSIPLPDSPIKTSRFCDVETELRRHTPATSEISGGDSSDLYLLFLSVKSCEKSRSVVRSFVRSFPKPMPCSLHGMYDLLGRWDLLVRLRCPNVAFSLEKLHSRLREARQMELQGPDFVDYETINVLRETKTFADLLSTDSPNPIALERKVLGRTEDYDSKRCQRGVLYMRLPTEKEPVPPGQDITTQEDIIRMLANTLDDDDRFQAIVEGIYRGENELVIESFMTCAQSQELNYVNRRIESILAKNELQKYTMFCYGYDEEEMTKKQRVLSISPSHHQS